MAQDGHQNANSNITQWISSHFCFTQSVFRWSNGYGMAAWLKIMLSFLGWSHFEAIQFGKTVTLCNFQRFFGRPTLPVFLSSSCHLKWWKAAEGSCGDHLRPSNWWYCTQMTWRIPRWLQKLLEHPVPDRTFLTFSRFNFNQRHGWHLSLAKGSSRYSIYVLQGFSVMVWFHLRQVHGPPGRDHHQRCHNSRYNQWFPPCFSWGKIALGWFVTVTPCYTTFPGEKLLPATGATPSSLSTSQV